MDNKIDLTPLLYTSFVEEAIYAALGEDLTVELQQAGCVLQLSDTGWCFMDVPDDLQQKIDKIIEDNNFL